jgi:hypothetical protein
MAKHGGEVRISATEGRAHAQRQRPPPSDGFAATFPRCAGEGR